MGSSFRLISSVILGRISVLFTFCPTLLTIWTDKVPLELLLMCISPLAGFGLIVSNFGPFLLGMPFTTPNVSSTSVQAVLVTIGSSYRPSV